ncbi:MAG: chemotaxis protein CheA, partial [Thiohalomonadales bacterium]
GELLMSSGALTQRELDEALKVQSESVGKPPLGEKSKIGEILVENKILQHEIVELAIKKQVVSRNKLGSGAKVLRVDANKLDDLINLVGELVISGATTNLLATRLDDENLLEAMSQMSRLVEEIRDSALNLRMVQIGESFNRFKRVVRDVSGELGKNIHLEICGADTELDKTVIEKIGDPLMHLVRNAMDHGIETAEERSLSEKPKEGNLKLNAFHESGSIVIEVEDDGRGLDRDKILSKALERNLIVEGQVLTDHEIHKLVFESGFSTAEKVTNLSGRGVGMDVVKRNIESLRGTIDIDSQLGVGTKISIRLPLTLAIIDGFMVGVGESCYVIPLDMVLECIELDEVRSSTNSEQGYINLRGEVLPFVQLDKMFDEVQKANVSQNIVVVEFAGYKAGIVVDELLGEFQTVIKPMGKILQNLRGISGATILGTGDVAVILDIPNLVQRMVQQTNQTGQLIHASSNVH